MHKGSLEQHNFMSFLLMYVKGPTLFSRSLIWRNVLLTFVTWFPDNWITAFYHCVLLVTFSWRLSWLWQRVVHQLNWTRPVMSCLLPVVQQRTSLSTNCFLKALIDHHISINIWYIVPTCSYIPIYNSVTMNPIMYRWQYLSCKLKFDGLQYYKMDQNDHRINIHGVIMTLMGN